MSTKDNIAESIFDSISLIVEKRIANLDYDKTIVGTIVDITDAKNNIYTVSNGSAKFKAHGDGNIYALNDKVRVLIIDGDYSKEKFIQGKYIADDESKPITYVSPFTQVINITDNLSSQNKTIYNIIANGDRTEQLIETVDLNSKVNNDIYDTLSLRASFQTGFDQEDIRSGEYGIHIKLNFKKLNDDNQVIQDRLDLYFSSDRDMFGNPYSFKIFTSQEITYKLSQWPGDVISAELYLYQKNNFQYFDETKNELVNLPAAADLLEGMGNIRVKDIYFGFGSEIAGVEDNKIKLYTDDTLTFTKNNNDTKIQKTLKLLWYNKTENNQYLGFADGINDLNYDEAKYRSMINYNQRLLQYKTKDNIPHDENCLDLWADIQDINDIAINLSALIAKDLHATLQGFRKYLTGIDWGENNPFDALLSGSSPTYIGTLSKKLTDTAQDLLDKCYEPILKYTKSGTNENKAAIDISNLSTNHNFLGTTSTETSTVKTLNDQIISLLSTVNGIINSDVKYKSFVSIYTSYNNRLTELQQKIKTKADSMYSLWWESENSNNIKRLTSLYDKTTSIGEEYGDLRNNEEFVKANDNRYCIYWYRYDVDLLDSNQDDFMPAGWERLTEFKNHGLPSINEKNDYYDKKPKVEDSNGYVSTSLRLKQEEKFQVVLFYNHEQFNSNIVTFTNTVLNVEDIAADRTGAFYIEHGDKSKDSYQAYNSYGTLINASDSQISRKLIAKFDGETGGQERLIGTTLYWYIPNHSTMINIFPNDVSEFTLIDSSNKQYIPGYNCYTHLVDKETTTVSAETVNPDTHEIEITTVTIDTANPDDTYFPYHISQYYQSNFNQNTILCKTLIGDTEYLAEMPIAFSAFGTNGTDYTLALLPDPVCPAAYYEKEGDQVKNNGLMITASLFNHIGEEISIPENGSQVTINWNGPTGYDAKFQLSDTAVITGVDIDIQDSNPPVYAGILEFKIKDVAIENRKVNLSALIGIPYTYNKDLYMEGPTSIIYDNFGTSPSYYKMPYKLYSKLTGAEVPSITWYMRYYYKNNSTWNYYTLDDDNLPKDSAGDTITGEDRNKLSLEYVPKLVNNELQVSVMYLHLTEDQAIYPVVIAEGQVGETKEVFWAQPLLILQNQYSSPMINAWDGSLEIDEENGTIMAPMLGAGRKNENNEFEGVLMGDVATKIGGEAITQTGLYGFHGGVQSFGFKVDGTAFLGKSSGGRIYIDGNNAFLYSQSWLTSTKFDDSGAEVTTENNNGKDPTSLEGAFNNDGGPFKGTAGMLIDLKNGYIDAYNFKLTSGNFTLSNSHISPGNQVNNKLREWYGPEGTNESPNAKGAIIFKAGDDKFAITNNGYLFAQNGYFDGRIHARAGGTIGGWEIGENCLKTARFDIGVDSSFHMYSLPNGVSGTIAGETIDLNSQHHTYGWALGIGEHFGVTAHGHLYASGANITGSITANAGTIGGFEIDDTEIKANNFSLATANGQASLVFTGTNTTSISSDGIQTTRYKAGQLELSGTAITFYDENGSIATQLDFTDTSNSTNTTTISISIRVETDNWVLGEQRCDSHVYVKIESTNAFTIKKTYGYIAKYRLGGGLETVTGNIDLDANTTQNEVNIKNHTQDRPGTASSCTFSDGTTSKTESYQSSAKFTFQGTIVPKSDGNHDLGTSGNPWKSVYTSTGTCSKSDGRVKKNVSNFCEKHEKFFDLLQAVSYNFIDDEYESMHFGFIAQQVEQAINKSGMCAEKSGCIILPEKTVKNSLYSLRYGEFVALNTWQIQKLKPRMTEAEERIYKLEQELAELKSKII